MTFAVAQASNDDLAGLLAIDDAFRRDGVPEWSLMSAETFTFKIRAGSMLVATDAGEQAGYLMWTPFWGFPFIEYIRVISEKRGVGIGTAMLAALADDVKQLGYHMIWSSTQEARALRWHERNGFRQIGEIEWIWGKTKELVLMKELT